MTTGHGFLERFRPVGTPGAATRRGVPADRHAEFGAELAPLFTLLVDETTKHLVPAGVETVTELSDMDFQQEFSPAQAEYAIPVCANLDELRQRLLAGRRSRGRRDATGHCSSPPAPHPSADQGDRRSPRPPRYG